MNEFLAAAPVASVILVITVVVSLIAFSNDAIFERLILNPYTVSRGKRLYTLITSGLIHADYMHLFFNMFSFFFFARMVEERLGHWQFAFLYVVSLILSDLPSVAKHKEDFWYRSLGASGAVSAVIFSGILFYPLSPIYLMFIPIPIPGIIFGVLYLIYCSYASKRGIGNINHDAHLFGALSGVMITIILHIHVLSEFYEQITVGVQSLLHH